MNKKAWLDTLFYDIGRQNFDFKVSGMKKKENGEIISSKWKKYSEICFKLNLDEDYKLRFINQRQIFPNEVVIDLEEKTRIKKVVSEIKKYCEQFYIFETGSRGYHIHIFFKKELTEKQKLKIIRKFGGDEQLASPKHMINLEWAEHWKSGKIKKEVKEDEL